MKGETKKTMLFLSQDLIIQILLRLPAKSLSRFKCVSKSWLSLISDPKFARLHFEVTATDAERLVLVRSDTSEIQSINFNAPLHDASASAIINLNFNFPPLQLHLHERIRVLGSCRGFILLDYFPNLYLCNPTTGFCKQLPSPLNYNPTRTLRGFGYDSATDDYLVTILHFHPLGVCILNKVELFSVKANAWIVWEGPPFSYRMTSRFYDHGVGLFFNEAIHWIARTHHRRDGGVNLIVAFDLIERSFSEIALPDDPVCDFDICELWVFGGSLSLRHTSVIWVMEEYKVQSSWTRLPTVVPGNIFARCRTKSGDIVGIDGDSMRLVKFNVNGEVQEGRPYPSRNNLVMYTESLLSLPGDN